jgi:hypothetical protein
MRRVVLLAAALFILAGGIAVVAASDHRHKNARMGPANVASWYCQNRGQRWLEPQQEEIEAAWQHRERFYRVSFFVVSAAGLGTTALVLTLGSRSR